MQEKLFRLPKVEDNRGNLSYLENREQIPFNLERVYWIYDVPGGQKRGSHAFRQQEEIIIALSGSFDVVLDDGKEKRKHQLNRSYNALYVPRMMWRSLENFSTNSLCLVLASEPFSEDDYIRNYREFKSEVNKSVTDIEEANRSILSPKPPYKIEQQTLDRARLSTVFDCTLIDFPIIDNRAGKITPIHNSQTIPFDIERVFYVYDIPMGKSRGAHAHKSCHEILIAVSGSFEVELDDGENKRVVFLNRPMTGLHIPPGIWATEQNYSSGAVCLVLTSEGYEEEDYVRKYTDFKKWK